MRAPSSYMRALFLTALCTACAAPVLTPSEDAGFRYHAPDVATGPRLRVPVVRHTTLANGLSVISIESPESETIRMAFASRVASDSSEASAGVATLTAFAMRSGTLMPDGQVERSPELLGESIDVVSFGSGTEFRLAALPSEAAQAIGLLARLIQNPTLDAEALRRARSLAEARNAAEASQAFRGLSRMAAEALFGHENPFGHFTFGSAEERSAIADDAVRRFYASRYQPQESALLILGPLSTPQDLALAQASFGSWRPAQMASTFREPEFAVTPPDRRPSSIVVLAPERTANLVVLMPCPRRDSPETFAGDLTATLVGRLWSVGLNRRFRHDSGTSYLTSAECLQSRSGGVFKIVLDSEPSELSATLATIQEQLATLADSPPAESELADARALYLGRRAIDYSTGAGLHAMLVEQFINGLPADYSAQLEARINAVTAQDIQTFVHRYLSPQNRVVAVEGAKRELAEPVTHLGNTIWKSSTQAERGE